MTEEKNTQPEKTNRRTMRTRQQIREAFIRLMRKKDYDSITVTDISVCAGINRKTFYAHYETKEQLFRSMICEMFRELFGIFMYEKGDPGEKMNRDLLEQDVIRYFETVERYREELEILITARTSDLAFQIGEGVILEGMEKIHVMSEEGAGRVPSSLFVTRIISFFLMSIDWWLDQTEYSVEEAASFYCKMMRKNVASIFRYQRMAVTDKAADISSCTGLPSK